MSERERLRDALLEALALKELPRAGWLRVGLDPVESVAAHSWGVAWLVLALCPKRLDRGRALAIAIVHDLAEVRTGDITPHDGVPAGEKNRREAEALADLVAPVPAASDLVALQREYATKATAEARFVRACDKLDMALQAARYAAVRGADTREFVMSALESLDGSELSDLVAPG